MLFVVSRISEGDTSANILKRSALLKRMRGRLVPCEWGGREMRSSGELSRKHCQAASDASGHAEEWLSHSSKLVEPRRGLAPGVSD
jgi:hypothetical protein